MCLGAGPALRGLILIRQAPRLLPLPCSVFGKLTCPPWEEGEKGAGPRRPLLSSISPRVPFPSEDVGKSKPRWRQVLLRAVGMGIPESPSWLVTSGGAARPRDGAELSAQRGRDSPKSNQGRKMGSETGTPRGKPGQQPSPTCTQQSAAVSHNPTAGRRKQHNTTNHVTYQRTRRAHRS